MIKCLVSNSNKYKFLKEQRAKKKLSRHKLSNLTGIKAPFLSDLLILKDTF